MKHEKLSFLDDIINESPEEIEKKAKSYYLEVDVSNGIKKLAEQVNKTESKFVNELLKAVVDRYLNETHI